MIDYQLLTAPPSSVSPSLYPAVVLLDEQGLELMALPRPYLDCGRGELAQVMRGAWPQGHQGAEDGIAAALIARDELLERGLLDA